MRYQANGPVAIMSNIILSTLNARYIHASLGLRYLYANLGELQGQAIIREFIISQRPIDIAEQILAESPRIVGFGVYIWNIEQTTQVVRLLKRIRPELIIILGGPEVSYEHAEQVIVNSSDYLIPGQADLAFAELCRTILAGTPPSEKVIIPEEFMLDQLILPYAYYSEVDIRQRLVYVEASRGCPFKCEFCLSSLDKSAWSFDLDAFLTEMRSLYERGARHFKFVDRTFNLKIDTSIRILQFFLDRMCPELFLHFEVIPDHLPDRLKEYLVKFPEGNLQLEIGIQTFNPEIQRLISRKQDNIKSMDNIRWLRRESHAHLHTDLILGLPGENVDSVAKGFDALVAISPHEIQVGILKRLRGTPVIRHTDDYAMRYNPDPPYNILQTRDIDFSTMQRLTRFARYWDLIANSGRFPCSIAMILANSPFGNFLFLSDWIFATTKQTHAIALERLFELVYRGMWEVLGLEKVSCAEAITTDYQHTHHHNGIPPFISGSMAQCIENITSSRTTRRQARHQAG